MDIKSCLLFLSLLFAGAAARPAPATPTTLPPCTPWCAGQPPPPPGALRLQSLIFAGAVATALFL